MNIALKKQYEDWIAREVKSGRYASEAEVIEDALATKMREDDAAWKADGERLRERFRESLQQAERGEVVPADDAFFERLRDHVRQVARRR